MTERPPPHPGDATVQVIHDALAFATAAIDGDTLLAVDIAKDGIALDRSGFLDALASVVQVVADDALEAGTDVRIALRELGLGVHVAHLAELAEPATHDHDHDPDRS